MDYIMDCDHSLDRMDIFKLIYYFMILFYGIYIFKIIVSTI
jgi:hypothetical protein